MMFMSNFRSLEVWGREVPLVPLGKEMEPVDMNRIVLTDQTIFPSPSS